MNTYSKFCPNVFLAKCTELHDKGEIINITAKYGQEHECYKRNPDKREHSFSLTYAKKAVNEAEKNLEIAKKLWA